MLSMNLSDIAILSIKGSDYCCIISLISQNEAINLMQNADMTIKSRTSQNIKNLLSLKKMGKEVKPFHIMLPKTSAYVKLNRFNF